MLPDTGLLNPSMYLATTFSACARVSHAEWQTRSYLVVFRKAPTLELSKQFPLPFVEIRMPRIFLSTAWSTDRVPWRGVACRYGLMAGFGMQLYGVVQDLGQLKRIYGDGFETFIGNSGFIQYFGSRDRMSADYFSALCGETTVWNFSSAFSRTFGSSSGGGGGSSSSINDTDTTAAAQRKLAYPDELMRLPQDKQLVFIENMNPIIATKVDWFEDEKLKSKGVNLHSK